ncbi:Subunit of the RNA polymerase II mediator complex [Cordyceps javanica]|uniref:Subunit of the RNA polymerase II mediator complex n=1 Tax=Cordyceps javanica TaxID=43265 RepID=A0A545V7F6_9HYPO|nr:Subunit of the RNA polymerase II mediator complex [Cordyceps javanica]TQW09165.1 Subunit of the RNA polymerase II mediator complex [Cordyceps javanica]
MASEKASEKALLAQPAQAPQEMPTEAYPASDNYAPRASTGGVPTLEDPFNFPTDEALPAYSAHPSDASAPPTFADGAGPSSSVSASAAVSSPTPPGAPGAAARPPSSMKPIAIPQVVPDASSPFLGAYPPCLLARGITERSWQAFLETVSAFLTAKVGDRAVRHAGDMAKHLASDTTNLGKNIANHGKSLGKDIARHAKRGNIFGVAATLVAGAVSLPVMTALGAVGTVTRLPGAAVGAVTRKPKTPADRVNAYNAVANGKWLHQRGLHVQLVDTPGLAHVLALPTPQLLAIARSGKAEGSAEGMLRALDMHIEPLRVPAESTLGLSDKTLWLVLVEFEPEELEAALAREEEEKKTEEELAEGRLGRRKREY